MQIVSYKGIFSIRESDRHPIVTSDEFNELLVTSGNDELLESGQIKEGDNVRFLLCNGSAIIGIEKPITYCRIICPCCGYTF